MATFEYKIYVKDYLGKSVKLPVLPSELPEVTQAADTEDFLAIKNGHYTIIKSGQQPQISAEHLMPKKGKKLTFTMSQATATDLINILEQSVKKSTPITYTIAKSSGGYYINHKFAVTSYSYHVDKKLDWHVSMELTGWQDYKGWKKAIGLEIEISPKKATIKRKAKKTAKLKNVPAKSKITWKSANKKIATVNSKGIIVGKKKGKTKITATYKKKKYTCEVGVK